MYEGFYNKSTEQYYYRIVRSNQTEWQDSSNKRQEAESDSDE